MTGLGPAIFTLRNAAGAAVAAAVSYQPTGRVATLDPSASLAAVIRYAATLTGGAAGIRDAAGNPFTTLSWSFLTGPAPP